MLENKTETVMLENVSDFMNGGPWKQTEYVDKGIRVARVSDFVGNTIDLSACKYLPETSLEKYSKHQLQTGDLVIATVGSHPTQPNSVVGRPVVVPETASGSLLNQNAVRIRSKNEKLDQRYLTFLAQSQPFRDYIIAHARGAANQVRMSIGLLKQMPISLPLLSIQHRIVSFLSAYDDLIENNTRRIAILEEMAQRIYTEWFVHFRFPGHEKVKMVDSELGMIPNGWEVSTLGQNLASIESGKRPKGGVGDLSFGIPSVGAENIRGIGLHNFLNEKYISKEFYKSMKKGVVKDRDIGLYKDGAYIGRSTYFRDGFPHREFSVNEHVFLLRTDNNRVTQNLLYLWLQQQETINQIRSTNANAAQPGINQNGIKGLQILTATPELSKNFDETVEPFLSQIINTAKKINNLRKTRDLLLPKLISGEIDVSKMEIAA